MNFIEELNSYLPKNEQERKDLAVMKDFIFQFPNTCLLRENKIAHFSASAWVINQDCTKVLLNFHNIYKNWGWLGGHADGEAELLNVSLKEVREESGLTYLRPLMNQAISLEILPVPYHWKNGKFVNAHLHLNVTYLIQACDDEQLHIKPDEGSGLKWVKLEEAPYLTTEEQMKPIYEKLNQVVFKYNGTQ